MQLQLYGKKIWVYRQPIDFRCGIDGLSYLVINTMKCSVKDGLFLFVNRRRDKLKCLSWHKNGFIMLYKRLEVGLFSMAQQGSNVVELSSDELGWLLAGLEWPKMRNWQELNYDKFS